MFDTIKKEMIQTLQHMSVDDNYIEKQDKIDALFNILISAKLHIPKLFEEDPVIDKYEGRRNFSNNLNGYPLIRKLKGGILQISNEVDIYVPETIIRSQNLKHGDIIKPSKNNNLDGYYFQKLKDGPKIENDTRGEIDYCIVSENKIDQQFTASQHLVDGEPKLIKLDNDLPITFIISLEDTQKFKLEPGSIVSIAYDIRNPKINRVIWNYEETAVPKRPKPSGHYKSSNTSSSESEEPNNEIVVNKDDLWVRFENTKDVLIEKKILLLGSDFKKAQYIQLAHEVNFDLTVMTGHERESQIQAAIRNSDMVLIASGHLTHHRSELPRDICKLYGIPMRFISSNVAGMKRGLLDLIENPEVLVSNSY